MKTLIAIFSFLAAQSVLADTTFSSVKTNSELITISAVGDIMPGTNFPAGMRLPEDGGVGLFKDAKPYIQSTDIRFGNFEGTLFDGPAQPDGKTPGPGRYMFRAPTKYADLIQDAGFNVMSLANNHAKDFGRAGIESTKAQLAIRGIQYSSKDGEVAELEVKGKRIALIAFDAGNGSRTIKNISAMTAEVRKLKMTYDIVIVSAHAGAEGENAMMIPFSDEVFLGENRGNTIQFARSAVDAGADLLIMHGPHVPRAMEVYNNKLIIYSLGNFATSYGISVSGYAGVAPLVRIAIDKNGNFVKGHLASFRQIQPPKVFWDKELTALKLIESLSKKQFDTTRPEFNSEGYFYPQK